MPTAVEYDPEKGEIPPGPGISPTGQEGDGSVRKGDGSVRWGLVLPGVLVLIIVVCFLFLPGQTLMSFFGCPSSPGGGEHIESFGDSARGGFLATLNALRVGIGGPGNAIPPGPCFSPLSAPVPPPPGQNGSNVAVTVEPPFFVTATMTLTPAGLIDVHPKVTQPAAGPACTPNPGDGICSACENTDIDSASCVCNMNGVCDPHEGFNCPDCAPTALPTGERPGSKNGGKPCQPSAAGVPCR